MFRLALTAALFLLAATSLPAQNQTRYFELTPPPAKVRGSLYRHLEFLDSREDTALIGVIQTGLLKNRDANLVFKTPILPQFQELMSGIVDSGAQDGTVLFQLRDLSFVEPTDSRYLHLCATLYVRTDGGYRKLSTIDTTRIFDVTDILNQIKRVVNWQLDNFISAALTNPAADSVLYSPADLAHIDSIEMHRLPVYTSASFTDGLYLSFSSFSKQLPDRQAMVTAKKDGSISAVQVLDEQAKKVKLKPKDVYAIVYQGRPFIATEYGYYRLERAGDNFFFTGDIRIKASQRDINGGQMALGLLGAYAASRGNQETYDLRVDHLNGSFIHLHLIPKPQTP
jgi:hypothetical protein